MTATDELRRLLDERGVECRQTEWIDGTTVIWRGSDGSEYGARNGLSFDGPTGMLVLFCLTPEQAVEATLGRGTCRQIETEEGFIVCSECGAPQPEDYTVYYCWCCGRKVVGA